MASEKKSSGSSKKSIRGMDGAKMILRARVGKELENFTLMVSKRVLKAFHLLRWKEIFISQRVRIFFPISQGLNQSLELTELADARPAAHL
jgi:hypothetical protein